MTLQALPTLDSMIFLLLALLWALLLFGGFALGKANQDGTHRIPTPARIRSSITLVVFAWGWFLSTQTHQSAAVAQLAFFTALGMSLGFVGDLFMARLIPLGEPVFGGIGAFGLGHVCYITGLWGLGDALSLNEAGLRWGALLVGLAIGALFWYLVVWRGGSRSSLHLVALPYALLLAGTFGVASGLALHNGIFLPVALGALLFLLSDLLLAAQLFNNLHFRLIGDLVWFTYGPGQMLIVTSLAVAAILGG